jgi:tyrosyl-tRNA synthetase
MFYGKDGADKGADYFTKVITEKGMPEEIPTMSASSTNIVDVLVETGLAGSKSEARRLIEQGGVEINGVKVSNVAEEVPENAIIKKGKRDFIKLD